MEVLNYTSIYKPIMYTSLHFERFFHSLFIFYSNSLIAPSRLTYYIMVTIWRVLIACSLLQLRLSVRKKRLSCFLEKQNEFAPQAKVWLLWENVYIADIFHFFQFVLSCLWRCMNFGIYERGASSACKVF